MRTRRWMPLLIALLVPLAGCGAVHAGGAPARAGGGPAAAASSAGAHAPEPASRRVTMADNNRTITLRVGQTFILALGDEQWQPSVADQTILARVPNYAMVRGAQGIYRAYRPGTTTLTATGRPACQAGQACPMFVILFRVTVQVTSA